MVRPIASPGALRKALAVLSLAAWVGCDPTSTVVLDAGFTHDATSADASVADAATDPRDAAVMTLDDRLALALADELVPVTALPAEEPQMTAWVALGEALFFDPIVSGNKDVACASCHQGDEGTGDALPLNLGTGARGSGPDRAVPTHPPWGARHTPDLWNRGRMDRLFWDGRVARVDGAVTAGVPVPDGLDDPLAVQALHPIVSPQEMQGAPGDMAVDGTANELAGGDASAVYAGLEARLQGIAGYVSLFEAATGEGVVRIGDVARALAAFQRQRYAATETRWDRYLRGDLDALDVAEKLGAITFFQPNGCSGCHSGPHLTDERMHNIGVPLLEPIDTGAGDFAFRTPPLRNVAASPPYMHNGTIETLDDAIAHYGRPLSTARDDDGSHLPADLFERRVTGGEHIDALLATLSEDLPVEPSELLAIQTTLSNLLAFVRSLVDEDALERARQRPGAVPSGLTVGGE